MIVWHLPSEFPNTLIELGLIFTAFYLVSSQCWQIWKYISYLKPFPKTWWLIQAWPSNDSFSPVKFCSQHQKIITVSVGTSILGYLQSSILKIEGLTCIYFNWRWLPFSMRCLPFKNKTELVQFANFCQFLELKASEWTAVCVNSAASLSVSWAQLRIGKCWWYESFLYLIVQRILF